MAYTTFKSDASKKVYGDILCCICGVNIQPNAANMCINCLRSREDITAGITKEVILHQCRGCERYNRNGRWVVAAPESPALMALCMAKVNGLSKVRLVNAEFIWTEPHSRRLKVSLTVQKEVLNNAKLQQEFVVEYILRNQQCEECQRSYTEHTWKALVQLRQKVDHKRTFLYLEQLILKHNAHLKAISIEQRHNGMDFAFADRSAAAKFVDFLGSVVPTKYKTAKQLVSQDFKSNVARFKYTFSTEIAPICKHDIVVLPKSLAAVLGCIEPVVLVYQVTNFMRLVSPVTVQTAELTATRFWANSGIRALLSSAQMIEFTVLDCTPVVVTAKSASSKAARARSHRHSGRHSGRRRRGRGKKRPSPDSARAEAEELDDCSSVMASTARESGRGFGVGFTQNVGQGAGGMGRFARRISGAMSVTSTVAGGPKGKFLLADIDVARTRDMGVNDITFSVRSHMGNLLKAGDSVMGYDLSSASFNDADLNGFPADKLPEIILVKKCYPRRRSKKLPRPWKLKRLQAQLAEGETERKSDITRAERDMEIFLQDVEEDKYTRANVDMYKDPLNIAALEKKMEAADLSDVEEDFPAVKLDALLDEMTLADPAADPDGDDDGDTGMDAGAGAGAGSGSGAAAGAGVATTTGTAAVLVPPTIGPPILEEDDSMDDL